jgi:hypothetical protein
MCGGGGQEINYKELIPPETLEFRKGLYNFLSPRYGQGMEQYPGQLPYTQAPDQGQMAGLSTILQMLGYGPYQWPGMPGAPAGPTGGGNEPPPAPPNGGGGSGPGMPGGEGPGGRNRYRPGRGGKR